MHRCLLQQLQQEQILLLLLLEGLVAVAGRARGQL
jgi:hypothetical protein